MNLSIKQQLILGIALVHALLMGLFVYDLLEKEKEFLVEQHNKKASSLSKTLATTSTSWVLANDFIGLEEVVSSMEHYPGMKYIMVLNLQGQVLAHTNTKLIGQYLTDSKSIDLLKGNTQTKKVFENDNFVDMVSPILRDTQHIGWARIALGKEEINQELHSIFINGIIYISFAILLGVIFAYFMAINLTQGIYKILETIKKVKHGDKSVHSNLQRSDEIGVLSKEFDNMIDSLKSTQEELHTIIESIPNMVFLKEVKNLQFVKFNKAGEDLLGVSRDNLIGKSDYDLFPKEQAEFFIKKDREVIASGKQLIIEEEPIQTPFGERLLYTRKVIIKDENDKPKYLLGISEDITDKTKQEKLLFEQSKLASMGEMIGNIAHQWRQPLSVISTGASGLKIAKELDSLSDELLLETCDAINDNAQYLSKTIDDFRDFIKGDRKKVPFSLSENIESFLHLVEGAIKNNGITLIKKLEKSIYIDGYPHELIQCFINIFNNSKDALKQIETEKVFEISSKKEKDQVIVTFKDNAGGIPQDVISHIFEPYFTTKHKSQGTGLGLSMTYKIIVEGMHGTIEASNITMTYENQTYKGVQITLTFPLN